MESRLEHLKATSSEWRDPGHEPSKVCYDCRTSYKYLDSLGFPIHTQAGHSLDLIGSLIMKAEQISEVGTHDQKDRGVLE